MTSVGTRQFRKTLPTLFLALHSQFSGFGLPAPQPQMDQSNECDAGLSGFPRNSRVSVHPSFPRRAISLSPDPRTCVIPPDAAQLFPTPIVATPLNCREWDGSNRRAGPMQSGGKRNRPAVPLHPSLAAHHGQSRSPPRGARKSQSGSMATRFPPRHGWARPSGETPIGSASLLRRRPPPSRSCLGSACPSQPGLAGGSERRRPPRQRV